MTTPLVQRLSLVVDAATGSTETRMDALATSSREAGSAAQRSAGQVAAAAERVAAAQLRRDDAAGKVAVAEARLRETEERGTASASQLLAATERLESARRGLAVAERGVATAQAESAATQDAAAVAAGRTATETERARVGSERLRGQLDGLKGAAAGVTAFAVGDWARDQVSAYLDGARGAQTLALSMNATVEQGGRLTALFSSLGLQADDLLEIQAEFAQKAGDQGQALEEFGASLQKNRDGTINWASTLTDALEQLQKIPDATERNRLGFQLFGEEGYKQLSKLLTSGVSVREAMERIGTPFTEEDIRAAQEFDRNMAQLNLSGADLGRTLARGVVPTVTALAEAADQVLSVLTAIPAPVGITTAALVTMSRLGWNPLTKATELTQGAIGKVREAWAGATDGVEAGSGRMRSAMAGARGAASSMADVVGGPLGVAGIAASVVYSLASDGADKFRASAHEAAVELERTSNTMGDSTTAVADMAAELDRNAGYWDRVAASAKGVDAVAEEQGGFTEWLNGIGAADKGLVGLAGGFSENEIATRGFADQIEEARKELGELGAQEEAASLTQRDLTDLIGEGTTSGQEFADAVQAAADAEAAQSLTSDTATAALAAYHAQTDQAVESVRGLIDAQLSQQDAGYAFLSSLDALNSATDDAKTSVDEVAQAHTQLQETALRAGDAAADAAVQQARAAGAIVTPLDEAKIRADALIDDLRARLNTPGLSDAAKADLQGLVDRLTEAREKGDVTVLTTLTGVDTATSELDAATEDRDTHVNLESRGGPAVAAYLDRLTADRLAIIRTETRNGPAVGAYLDRLTRERLAIIRVETRGGPAVDDYLDELAGRRRVAVITAQSAGGTGAGGGPVGAAYGASYSTGGVTIQQQTVQVVAEAGGRLSQQSLAEAGRQTIAAIAAYERVNGTGWKRGGRP